MVDLAAVGWSGLLSGAGFGLTAASLLASCWIDIRYRLVCNEACLAVLIGSVLMMLGAREAISLWHWGAMLAVAGTLAVLFAARLLGGGDLKLMIALLPGLGFWALALFVVWTAIAGGAIALIYRTLRWLALRWLVRRRRDNLGAHTTAASRHWRASHSFRKWLRHEIARIRRGKSIPYVPAIAAGWLVAQLA